MKRTPLKRKTPLRRTGRLRSMSDKRREEHKEYMRKRAELFEQFPQCQICNKRQSVDAHHVAGRSGTNYLDEKTWLAVCRQCHDRVHSNPRWARERGFLV